MTAQKIKVIQALIYGYGKLHTSDVHNKTLLFCISFIMKMSSYTKRQKTEVET